MQNFFMMVGLPGSGKSTFARNVLSASPGAVVHSSDEIRRELLGDKNDQTQQALVFSTLHERVSCAGAPYPGFANYLCVHGCFL